MLTIEPDPIVLTADGSRRCPRGVMPMPNENWRVEWIDGLATLYRRDPRAHLRLGYDPGHLHRHVCRPETPDATRVDHGVRAGTRLPRGGISPSGARGRPTPPRSQSAGLDGTAEPQRTVDAAVAA